MASALDESEKIVDFTASPPKARRRDTFPEAMIELPEDNQALVKQAKDIIEICRSDAGQRTAYYRQLSMIVETGKSDGTRSLANMLYSLIDRLASHLFSPVEIRFTMDFENEYQEEVLKRGQIATKLLSRSFERTNTDTLFAQGVFESLKYGSAILKQWVRQDADKLPVYHSSLVMPWQFGVYRADRNDLDSQPAMVETILLTLPEVWRRIWHLPNAAGLFNRIKQHAAPGQGSEIQNSFFHQILSTSKLQSGAGATSRPVPGGIVQLNTDPSFAGVAPSNAAPMVMMHEAWVWDRDDYTTVQIIEPDILIAPKYKRSNLLMGSSPSSGLHPYSMIQPNQTHGNIWGRSEIMDLIEPQDFLSLTMSDIRRLFGLQVDKLLAFAGSDGLTDETYDQFREAGWANLGPGGSVTDLTPKFPEQALPLVEKLMALIETISGFDNMLSGRGEPGVRSGVQSNPMMKAAGARLKDRSLLVERQYAAAADLRLSIMEAKDGRNYWTNAENPAATQFLLSDIPEDRRVMVDAHTTSPIFADDHQNLVIGGLKLGLVDKRSAVEALPFQNRDILIDRMIAAERKQAKMMEDLKRQQPEEYAKLLEKSAGGRRR